MKKFVVALLVAAVFLSGCKKDKYGSMELNFKATWGADNPLVLTEKYVYESPSQLFFTELRLLISDVTLHKTDGSEISVGDVHLVDFTPTTDNLAGAQAGVSVTIDKIPVDEYTGISFNIGIPADLNAKTPDQFPDASPLSNENLYWTAWESYIYSTIAGRSDKENDGVFGNGFVYHTGGNDALQTKHFTHTLNITEDHSHQAHLSFDVRKVFINQDGVFDIYTINQVHTEVDLVNFLAAKIADAIRLTE